MYISTHAISLRIQKTHKFAWRKANQLNTKPHGTNRLGTVCSHRENIRILNREYQDAKIIIVSHNALTFI